MRTITLLLSDLFNEIPAKKREESRLKFSISNSLDSLMRARGMRKKQLADAIGKRPNEVTRWLSGEHNFTISTLAMLSTFFSEPIITMK